MASEFCAVVSHLFTQPLFLRLTILVGVVAVFSLLVFVTDGLSKAKSSRLFAIGKEAPSRNAATTLAGQRQ